MTSYSPRIYIYKITFEEVPYYYYGVHKEKKFNEEYWGSPYTNKWCWELYTPKKQILEIFPYNDEGWLEAQEVESRIIKPVFNTDKWCLNENCGGKVSLETRRKGGKKTKELGVGVYGRAKEQIKKDCRKGAKKAKELGIGIHGRTKEQMTEDAIKGGKISGKKTKELGIGIHGRTKEQMTEDGIKGGKKVKELGIGIHGLTPEQMSENSRKSGKKQKKFGIGIHGRTKEQMTEDGKKGSKIVNSQKWECCETGYVSTAAGLSQYQRKRGIDTSKRVRLS